MGQYRLSRKAAEDLAGIYLYSYQHFCELQADQYIQALEEKLHELAENPSIAMAVDDIRRGYRRALIQKHAIYFRSNPDGIFVVRILHQQMKTSLHI